MSLIERTQANLWLGLAIAVFWAVDHLARRRLASSGYGPGQLVNLTYWSGGGALLGARLLYMLPTLNIAVHHPLDMFLVNTGLSFYGALVGGAAGCALYALRNKLASLAVTDAYALFLPLGLAAHRLTCFVHGVCWGRPADNFLGVRFPGLTVARYPSELYEGFLLLALGGALLYVGQRWHKPGLASAAFLVGYATIRALVDLTRVRLGFWSNADPLMAIGAGIAGLGLALAVVKMKEATKRAA